MKIFLNVVENMVDDLVASSDRIEELEDEVKALKSINAKLQKQCFTLTKGSNCAFCKKEISDSCRFGFTNEEILKAIKLAGGINSVDDISTKIIPILNELREQRLHIYVV